MPWTAEQDRLIRKLWAEGLAATQIAAEIGGGVTRNAIIGRVHRLGLSGRASSKKDAREMRLEQEVVDLLKDANFKILDAGSFRRMMGDFVAEHTLLGKERRYAIEIAALADDAKIRAAAAQIRNYASQSKQPYADFDEFWVVTDEFAKGTGDKQVSDRRVRALDLRQLRAVLAELEPQRVPPSRSKATPRTKIGKALKANEREIDLAIAGLLLQIEEKLADLKNERPNSEQAIAAQDKRVADYERMRNELESVRQMVALFKKGGVKEAKVVQSVNTFADGVKDWWHKSHATICTRTFDLGLFASSVGICSMAGAGGKLAVVVSAALVGGKSVTGALKGLSKKIFAE